MTTILAHLDDVGVSHGSVRAWQALRRAGVVRSASVMVPCPYYPMARDDWHDDPEQCLGIHVTLTAEWSAYRWRPMIGPRGGLVDDEGFFPRRPEEVAAQADPAAVADEIAAQIERALEDGIRPTHVDAHMGTAFLPPFVGALLEAGKRYDLPVLACRDFSPLIHNVRIPDIDLGYLNELKEEVAALGWPVFDRFLIGFLPPDQEIEPFYGALLDAGGPGDHYLAMHADSAEGTEVYAPHMTRPRRQEFEFFGDPRSTDIFKARALTVVNWRDLAA